MSVKGANGKPITDEMLNTWCEALDSDEWPSDWKNEGDVIYGKPPLSKGGSVTLSIKVPAAMKEKIAEEAKKRGTTTSNYARALLAEAMLAS